MVEVANDIAEIIEQTRKKNTLIGKRFPKLDAPVKVKGQALYIDDMKVPRMLYGKILFAGRPHAKIVKIDTSAAKAMPGVRAVLTGNDVEHVPFGFGQDNFALKRDHVTCVRDEVAAVAADTQEIANEAVKRIGGHDHAGRAIPALHRAVIHERLLNGVESLSGFETLDGQDIRPLTLLGRHEAGVHQPPVEQHGAGPALAFATSFFGAGKLQIVAQKLEQRCARCNRGFRGVTIDRT